MLAYFSIIIEPDGTLIHSQGSLFKIPPELSDNFRIRQYASVEKTGWSVSEFGYLLFRANDDMGRSYILPGLYLEDGPKPSKKFYGYKASNSKAMIENYLKQHISRAREQRTIAEESTTALVHDLRHLSSAIYHSAEQAARAHENRDTAELTDSLKTIVATQTMLKARIDYLDYTTGIDRFETSERIPVYSRVDKVVRCFRAAARDKSVEIKLLGTSYRFTRGPNILDIVPYTLIDNAIKYSPSYDSVEVYVYDLDTQTVVSVSSQGPAIKSNESDRIFEPGFRGSNAKALRPSGTGIGLSVAKEIIGKFGGEVTLSQTGDEHYRDGLAYKTTVFSFSVPSSGEDKDRKFRSAGRSRFYGGSS